MEDELPELYAPLDDKHVLDGIASALRDPWRDYPIETLEWICELVTRSGRAVRLDR
jgi:hypothetical protein